MLAVDITLIGGGWDVAAQIGCLRPYLAAATERSTGGVPRVAFVWLDEGDGTDWGKRWMELVAEAGPVHPVDVAVAIGSTLNVERVRAADAVFVCGGLTPAYADALGPAAADLRRLVVEEGVPYAGSSAGAAVAARLAVVGGYLAGERVVCPPDAAEDLDPVTVVAGLGLVEEMVDVHASAWGTLPRLAAAMAMSPAVGAGLALDEDTAWRVTDTGVQVLGRNAVHRLDRDGDGLRWTVKVPSSGR